MDSRIMGEIVRIVDTEVQTRIAPVEFEAAYQVRVAIDRIKFAIKHTEQFGPQTDPMREVGLQLLDALQRLDNLDRRFQERSTGAATDIHAIGTRRVNGHLTKASNGSGKSI